MAVAAPVHRLAAAVDGAGVEDRLEDLDVGGVVVVGVGEVGVVPLAQDAQTLEALALGVDLLDRHLAAELADLLGGKLAELVAAHHVLDLVLDGQAVAVPAGDVRDLAAPHDPVAVDDVLGDLVLRVTQVDGAVGVRGAVVQHEALVAGVLLEGELVDARLVPGRATLGLRLGQPCPHGELGLGQVHRVLVLVCHFKAPSRPRGPSVRTPKEAPVPPCWDKAPPVRLASTTQRAGDPQYSAGLSRRPLRRRLRRMRAFGPQLRGDVPWDADAGSQHPRSL